MLLPEYIIFFLLKKKKEKKEGRKKNITKIELYISYIAYVIPYPLKSRIFLNIQGC